MHETILVIDDHPLFRDALCQLLQVALDDTMQFVFADSAEDGLHKSSSIEKLSLILLDIGLPGLCGADAVSTFKKKHPLVPILVLSASEDRRDVDSILRAGAHIFVSKAIDSTILIDTIRRVLANEVFEPRWITPSFKVQSLSVSTMQLTQRQHEVLALLMQGYGNKEIALRLGLAEITIKLHVSSIFRALNVNTRTQAVMAARRLGIDSLISTS